MSLASRLLIVLAIFVAILILAFVGSVVMYGLVAGDPG